MITNAACIFYSSGNYCEINCWYTVHVYVLLLQVHKKSALTKVRHAFSLFLKLRRIESVVLIFTRPTSVSSNQVTQPMHLFGFTRNLRILKPETKYPSDISRFYLDLVSP